MMNDERMFLGQLIQDPEIYYETDIIESHFIQLKNKDIFNCIKNIICEGYKPDILMLCEKLKHINTSYIATLVDDIPTSANWKHYQNKLIENPLRCKLY